MKTNKSFLKWAGNKFRVLPNILPFIGNPNQFIEPFAGSLSVSMNVNSNTFILNDYNKDLVSLYNFILNDNSFIQDCQSMFLHSNTEKLYYSNRETFNTTKDDRLKAMLFIYLNRHCFNGLTRYNKSGEFNVPYGKYKSPYFPLVEMKKFQSLFQNKKVKIFNSDFSDNNLYSQIDRNTVVYLDPPYVSLSETSNFVNYTHNSFTWNDQVRVKDLAVSLSERGAKVIVSNHDTEEIRELYSTAKITKFQVQRSISAKGNARRKVDEILAIWEGN